MKITGTIIIKKDKEQRTKKKKEKERGADGVPEVLADAPSSRHAVSSSYLLTSNKRSGKRQKRLLE